MGILPFSGAGAAAKAVGHGKEECYKNKRGSGLFTLRERKDGEFTGKNDRWAPW